MYTFHRLNLGNNHVAHIVVGPDSIITWMDGPFKRGIKIYYPVGWSF